MHSLLETISEQILLRNSITMLVYLSIAAIFPALILGYPNTACPDGSPAPIAIRIVGCDSTPCHVDRGGSVTYEVDFSAVFASDTLLLSIHSTVFGETNPILLPPDLGNACNGLIGGASCPVAHGQQLTHGATIPVDTELHDGVPAQLRFRIFNASGVTFVCALVNIVIH